MKVLDVSGRVVAVTGAASGIGAATARLFGAEGADVQLLDRDAAGAERIAGEIRQAGGKAQALALDVTEASAVDAAFDAVRACAGRLDALVNCAGVSSVGTLLSSDEAELERVCRVNVHGTYLTSRAAVRIMIEQQGGGAYPGREAEVFEQLSKYQPLGRTGRPDEVAVLALYLCSSAAEFITGQALPLDGGVLVH